MTWLRLSFKEWQRRPLRSSITMAGIAIATAALFSLLSFQAGYRTGVRHDLDRLGAHVLVVPKGCPYDAASIALHGANWPCYLKARYLDEVRGVHPVAAAAPVFMAATYGQEGAQAVFVGIDTNILALKPSWRINGNFPAAEGELLIGSDAAHRRSWHIGDQVQLPDVKARASLDAPLTTVVAGILEPTHGADDSFIFMRLSDAQARFNHPNELTHILIRLKDPNQLDDAVAQLRGCDAGLSMNIVPVAYLFQSIRSIVNSTHVLFGSIALVALLAAGAMVANTILMSVSERTRVLGVMRALGASRAHVFRLVLLETLQVCVAGAVLGIVLAFLCSRAVEHWARAQLPFTPTDALLHWQWWIAAACIGCAVLVGILAGLLPASRAAFVPPVSAMRGRNVFA